MARRSHQTFSSIVTLISNMDITSNIVKLNDYVRLTQPCPDKQFCWRPECGYIIIPDNISFDQIDNLGELEQINGISFKGYVFSVNDNLIYIEMPTDEEVSSMDQNHTLIWESLKKKISKCVGFSDNHIQPNELDIQDGLNYLEQELRKLGE